MKALILLAALASITFAGEPAVTIYNQNFAVVRDTVPLDLKTGVNEVRFNDVTAQVEPDSVILRDPGGSQQLQILEQNYRNDPISQELLLSIFEGKTIDFFIREPNKPDRTLQGKIVRSGYAPREHEEEIARYLRPYYPVRTPRAMEATQPIIEVDGKIQFGLPVSRSSRRWEMTRSSNR
jgi:hypothetical protein